jgi:hypothetical protein
MMLYQKVGDCHITLFDSLSDVSVEVGKVFSKSGDELNNSRFVGRHFGTPKELFDAVNGRWADGIAAYDSMMLRLRDKLIAPPTSLRRRTHWNEECGDELNLDRLKSGAPYWRDTKREHRPGPINVTIVTDMGAAAYRDSMSILWRGMAAICLTELLEAAGYRVELWVVDHGIRTYTNWDNFLFGCCLKRTGDPLDVSAFINAVSGWFLRTIGFAATWISPATPQGSYGMPTVPPPALLKHLTPDEQCILCAGVWSEMDATYWVEKQLEKIDRHHREKEGGVE